MQITSIAYDSRLTSQLPKAKKSLSGHAVIICTNIVVDTPLRAVTGQENYFVPISA